VLLLIFSEMGVAKTI